MMKERAVGAEQDEFFTARQAAFEQQFQTLPAIGSEAYWQRIEGAPAAEAMPVEVLCHCLRERWRAGARQDVGRVFAVIVDRLQIPVQAWARRIATQGHESKKLELEDDLEQECYEALWKELSDQEDTFLLVHFWSAVNRLEQHVAHAFMEREGLWKRNSVVQPKRIQRKQLDSLEAQRSAEAASSLAEGIADPTALDHFEQIESMLDLLSLLEKLEPKMRTTIYSRFVAGQTPQEIAAALHLTDRAVNHRIEKALKQLAQLLSHREEEQGG
jgi:RNA polymerase sigma factor (sigma-70 family)